MSDARMDATPATTPATSTITATTTRPTAPTNPQPGRTRSGALLSVSVAAAAIAALAAPAVSAGAGSSSSWTLPTDEAVVAVAPVMLTAEDRADAVERSSRSSRSTARGAVTTADQTPEPAAEPEPEIVGTRYTTVDLNVRTKPDADAKVVAVLDTADKVKITDVKEGEFRQVVYKDELRWVRAEFLSKTKPDPKPAGPSSAACASGSGVEGGLASTTIAVHRAVCNAFPSVSSYGGTRGGGGNHGSGHALDIMVSGGTGDQIAAYVRAHASQLGVSEVIWAQKIWTVQRAGDGWRWMSDRGGATANHYDHVHVSTY